MSKRRKSRRLESSELEQVRARKDADRRSMKQGLSKISSTLEVESHDPNDTFDDSEFWKMPAMALLPSWWSQIQMTPTPSTRIIPSFRLAFDPGKPSVDAAKLEALKSAEPYVVTAQIPDFVEVITAWRAWTVTNQDGYRLKALGVEHVWQPKTTLEAVCTVHASSHPAPARDCTCGVWAFKELDSLVEAIGSSYGEIKVLGQVSLWGRVIETENGYRAEKAYPSELWLFDSSLEELGLIYDVPVRMVT